MGRTPALTQMDAMLAHEVALPGRGRLRLQVTILNVFNQKTARHVFNWLNRGAGIARASSAIDLSRIDLAKGYENDLFNEGRQAQLMVRMTF